MGRAGIDLFIEDGAYTTLSSAVVILVVLTLLFSSTAAIWSMSRAGDTQVAADSGALAGANVVSSYHTAATVLDACILSLGLAGFATIGTGLVAMLIPGAEVAGADIVDTGVEVIKTRNKFAKSASKGLQKVETALPYLIAARAMQAVSAQDTEGVTYTGTALAVPRTSESDLPRSKGPRSRRRHRKHFKGFGLCCQGVAEGIREDGKGQGTCLACRLRRVGQGVGRQLFVYVGTREKFNGSFRWSEPAFRLEHYLGAAGGSRPRESVLPSTADRRGTEGLECRDDGGVRGTQGVLQLCERRSRSSLHT